MVWCAAAGVITGKQLPGGYFLDPQAGATRAEAAKVLVQADRLAKQEIDPYSLDELIEEGAEAEAFALAEGATETEQAAAGSADQPAGDTVETEQATFDDVAPASADDASTAEADDASAAEGDAASIASPADSSASVEALSTAENASSELFDSVTAQAA